MPSSQGSDSRARLELAAFSILFASLLAGCLLSLHYAWRWPLVGDSSLIRYAVFLMQAGKTPYAQVVDINLPGSYLLEFLAMRGFGAGAHGLRLYDGFLCLLLCVFSYQIGREARQKLLGLAAALLFTLVHLQDGIFQAGQRDLGLAVLLLGGLVLLARDVPLTAARVFVFELVVGFTLTVKPTLLPLALLPALLWTTRPERTTRAALSLGATGIAGLGLPVIAMFGWLWHAGAVRAFLNIVGSIDRLHGELGRNSLWFLLGHCTAPILILFVLWAAVLVTRQGTSDSHRKLLIFATLCGLLSYLAQGKGFPYQRYPFLMTALLLLFTDVGQTLRRRGASYAIGMMFLAVTAFWLAPRFTWAIKSFEIATPFQTSLAENLQSLRRDNLSSVQCLDTFGGCINTLYDSRTVQATGFLYDCYLFTPPSEIRNEYRRTFMQAFDQARPQIVVLTNEDCFKKAGNFNRILEWPDLAHRLNHDYALHTEWGSGQTYRWWSRPELPRRYMIYVRK